MTSRPPGAALPGLLLSGLLLSGPLLFGPLLSAGTLQAQPAPTQAEAAVLTGQVMPSLRPMLRAVLDDRAANHPMPWHDEASGLSGTVAAAPIEPGAPCRAIRVTTRDGVHQLALEGERCRQPGGDWGPGRVADAVSVDPDASPLVRDLQVALHRLDYCPGAIDGIASGGFIRALLVFEHDEGVPPTPRPDPALLDLADAAIGRIPAAGACPTPRPVPARASLACGSVR